MMQASREHPPLVARQPILDRQGRLVAYELLYRGARLEGADSDTAATAQVLIESLGSIGLADLVGSALMFVNFGEALLQHTVLFDVLPPDSIVIEVLESVQPSPQIIAAISALRARGFRIALDDFRYRESLEPLLALADYVKVDVLACTESLETEVAWLRRRGLCLVGEKIETHADLERCEALGFNHFQGYYFCRPKTIDSQPLAANQLVVLKLVAALQNPSIDVKELAEIISRDVALSYQLLKLSNSPLFRRRRAIATMQDATVVLGLDTLRSWATLLLLSRLGAGKPAELLRTALVRAHMCSSAITAGIDRRDGTLFTTGLLSVLDALLDRPMERVVADLALAPEITDALLGDTQGHNGRILSQVQAYEAGEWGRLAQPADWEPIGTAYLKAVASADRVLTQLLA
jgi:EAL and modified HD-GYP domain-containing signal transduction protein